LVLKRVFLQYDLPASRSHSLTVFGILQGLLDGRPQRLGVSDRRQPTRLAWAYHVGNAAGVEAYDRGAASHGLERGLSKGLLARRDDKEIREAVENRQKKIAVDGAKMKVRVGGL
jgi:hypothetical protein